MKPVREKGTNERYYGKDMVGLRGIKEWGGRRGGGREREREWHYINFQNLKCDFDKLKHYVNNTPYLP